MHHIAVEVENVHHTTFLQFFQHCDFTTATPTLPTTTSVGAHMPPSFGEGVPMICSIRDIMGSITAGDGGVHQLQPTAIILAATKFFVANTLYINSSGSPLLSPSRSTSTRGNCAGTKSPWNPGAGTWNNM